MHAVSQGFSVSWLAYSMTVGRGLHSLCHCGYLLAFVLCAGAIYVVVEYVSTVGLVWRSVFWSRTVARVCKVAWDLLSMLSLKHRNYRKQTHMETMISGI